MEVFLEKTGEYEYIDKLWYVITILQYKIQVKNVAGEKVNPT